MDTSPILKSVRNWLGISVDAPDEAPDPAFDPPPVEQENLWVTANRQILDDVAQFLLHHRIAVDAESLGFAYDLVTNADPRLAGMVKRRFRERKPLDAEWIFDTRSNRHGDDAEAIARLRERLEKSVAEFSQTTHDARTATSHYQSALKTHVDELQDLNRAGEVISELASVANAMLSRTRDIEEKMARSERETRVLQKRLEEARRSAEHDHLTGLPNRRAFESLLEKEYAEARLTREALCVAFCDIDKFKAINDLHGHDAGDRVLKLVAQSLAEISDDRCHVARHGGEEFVMLFRGKTAREAFAPLDTMRETLATRRLVNRANDTPFGQVSFSAGLADLFAFPNPRAALKAADEALYLAKERGRNRIEIAVPDDLKTQVA
ncbi:MAG: diguanylate cyclase [Novosphingobium sp.]